MSFFIRGFVAAMLASLTFAGAAQELKLTAADVSGGPIGLNARVEAMHDATGTISAEAAMSADSAPRFSPLSALAAERSPNGSTWIRVTMSRTPGVPPNWVLRVRPATIEAATFYARGAGGQVQVTETGSTVPLARRALVDHNLVLPVEVDTVPRQYFLKIHSRHGGAPGSFELWQRDAFEKSRTTDYLFVGALLGGAAISLVLSLLFFAWFKDWIYFHYALYATASCVLAIVRQGYANEWFFAEHAAPPVYLTLAAFCFFNVVATAFISRLFHFREHSVWMARTFDFFIVFNALALCLAPTEMVPRLAQWVGMGSLVSTVLGASFVVYLIVVKRQTRYLVQAAALATGTFFGIYSLLHLWLLPQSTVVLPDAYRIVGAIIHLAAINIAVVDRTRRAEVGIRAERKRVLDVMRDAERTLEKKVYDRTAELTRTNEQLKSEVEARKTLQAQLRLSLDAERQAMSQQEKFVSMVSHEFRAPLAVIDAVAQSLDLSEVSRHPAVIPRVTKIRRSVKRLTRLIDNVLAADRVKLDQKTLRLTNVDLCKLTTDVCNGLGLPLTKRLKLNLTAEPLRVTCDRVLLEIAVQNLVLNALKYSSIDSEVDVTLNQVDGFATLWVTDRGPGVDVVEKERIFEKYHRAELTGSTPGTGLGLYLARDIAREHGGDAVLVDTGANGSTFGISVPSDLRSSLSPAPC
ncbi:MAG: histidine kinase [Comamonadaceae bacterium]|nr:MAG: histidine kinase [Comamonadaceae bacterium]